MAATATPTTAQAATQTEVEYPGRVGRSSKVVHLVWALQREDGRTTTAGTTCGTRGGRYGMGAPRKTAEAVDCPKCLDRMATRRS